jgi:hypothetical protein
MFVIKKEDMIQAYSGYNIVVIKKQFIGNASLIKETSEKSTSVTDSTRCSNEAILRSDGQIKISVYLILYRTSVKIHFQWSFI